MSDYTNAASSTLGGALSASATSTTLATGGGAKFPSSAPFLVRFGSPTGAVFELARVTSVSGDTLTLFRGAEGTVAQAWASGSPVNLVVPGGSGDPWNISGMVTRQGAPHLTTNAAQALGASAGTIATAGLGVSRVSIAANASGVILQAGTVDGQVVIVENTSATHTATFDVVGTSHVADGVSDVIAALTAAQFVWNATAGYWVRCV